jgi:hypothetical protein
VGPGAGISKVACTPPRDVTVISHNKFNPSAAPVQCCHLFFEISWIS